MTDPPTAELTARLQRVLGRLARLLRREVPSPVGPGTMSALSTLVGHGPMRPTELAAREGVRPPTLTRMLAILEEGGYVERMSDPADRRASLIAPTALGRQMVHDTRSARAGHLARHLTTLSPDERRVLTDALPVLEALAAADPDAEPTPPPSPDLPRT